MSTPGKQESLRDAYEQTLVELGERDPDLAVFEADPSGPTRTSPFGQKFPDRFFPVSGSGPTMMSEAAEMALSGRTVFASTPADVAVGQAYQIVREAICYPRLNVKIVANHGGSGVGPSGPPHPILEDIGLMRGLPGMTVIVPADAPTTRSAIRAIATRAGPAYLRLTSESLPVVTEGRFAVGRANELRSGADLTIVAVGSPVARALEAAEELGEVGVSVRVLDFASVKPFDEPALLRAARDTGAILVLEEHSVLTGVGALVASTTSENYPVPVRRVGIPDVFGESGELEARLDRYGISRERIRNEAWELLRGRGKVQ